MEVIADAGVMTSLEMVEVNPILDQGNASAAFAVELVNRRSGRRSCRAQIADFSGGWVE